MQKLYSYADATKKCEELTKQMIEDVGGIVFSVRALEHDFLLVNIQVEKAACCNVSGSDKATSLPSYMLVRELKKLNLSLEALKASIRRNITESLSHLDSVTSSLEMDTPENPCNLLSDAFCEYKKVLIKSIRTLKNSMMSCLARRCRN
ncbi:hypothetical protein [Pseudomonas sp. Z2-11]